ncbi:MAG TPA: RDD family protein, partial [Candidatus Dormibacteraeota bacterium]|nr:RDD family protein [Candidatus Dormibacteraeota bacterium]
GMVAGVLGVCWAAYQYLLLVYSGATPGLRLARLQLARFDGSPAGRRLRRWRVLASFLSAASLGMGYAWVFLDEDSLCWHDRITHTYLGAKRTENAAEKARESA